jgi:uncharacterized repeat protein (TIGR03803 family)
MAIACTLTAVLPQSVQAQTFNVIHNFTGADGAAPSAGVTIDKHGNLYGTTALGGTLDAGTVFELRRSNSGFVFNPLYSFAGVSDGAVPYNRPIFGWDGTLYGTTAQGAGGACDYGCGTVFNLRPPPTICKTALCPWTETVLYRFRGGSDGSDPEGDLIFDQVGNLYGTTTSGGIGNCGPPGCGVAYKLIPSNGAWTQNVLYSFGNGANDGANPVSGVIFDSAGNLYGTTMRGGSGGQFYCPGNEGCGTVFELTPSGLGWTEKILYNFGVYGRWDGRSPVAGLIFDGSGNLYGATYASGSGGGGTVFELSPSGGLEVLYSFTGYGGPADRLVMDASGNLYGTTRQDGLYPSGSVFKLSRSNGSWTYTSLHDFTGGSDGAYPNGVTLDANGNLYGTAQSGGAYGSYGVVWEITP